MPALQGAPDSDVDVEDKQGKTLQQGHARNSLSSRVLGAVLGLTLFGLYLSLLARDNISTFLSSRFPGLPGSRFLVPAALSVLAFAIASVLVARRAGWDEKGWRVWQEALLPRWLGKHAVAVTVAGVTLGALAIRIFGISDNLPYINYPDEPAVADRAINIIQSGDYNPHYFVYPSLYYYMQAGVFILRFFALVSSGKIVNLEGIHPTDFYLWGRLLTALLGALTVPLVYAAGRRLYGVFGSAHGTVVGLAGAAFMAASSVHIVFSQLITTDVPAAFFSALSFLMIARLLPSTQSDRQEESSDKAQPHTLPAYSAYLWAGISMGLALSTKYNSALVLLPFLLAHLYASWDVQGDRLRAFLGPRLWLGLAGTVGAFLVTTPFAIFDLPTFLNDVASVITHYNFGHAGHEGEDNWLFYIQNFLSSDTIPTLLTLGGVLLAFARHKRQDILVLSFPLAFYLSMSSYRVNFTRNLLPILPFTSILAALPLALLWQWAVRSGRWEAFGRLWAVARSRGSLLATGLLVVVMGLSVLPATQAALQRGYRQSQPDTRVRASEWLDANTRPGTKLWLEAAGPTLTPGRYITDQGGRVVEHPLDWYTTNHFEYLVLNANAYKTIVYDQPATDPPTRNAYLSFFKENEQRLAVSFDSNETDTPGPTVKIYRTGYTPPRAPGEVAAQHPIGSAFNEIGGDHATVLLIGADYPTAARAGSTMPITLYWDPDKKMSANYTVFVHLVNGVGDVPVQRDTEPRDGTYPTSIWQPGEVVADEADLNLPQNLPPGQYTLRIGIYLQLNGKAVGAFTVENAPPGSGQDYKVTGPITIMPSQ